MNEESRTKKAASVAQHLCVACGFCVQNCPAVFHFAKNGKAEGREIPDDVSEDASDAMLLCPVGAIQIK